MLSGTSSTSGLRMHITRKPHHYEKYLELCEANKIEPSERCKIGDTETGSVQLSINSFTVPIVKKPKWPKEGLLAHYVEFVVSDDQVSLRPNMKYRY